MTASEAQDNANGDQVFTALKEIAQENSGICYELSSNGIFCRAFWFGEIGNIGKVGAGDTTGPRNTWKFIEARIWANAAGEVRSAVLTGNSSGPVWDILDERFSEKIQCAFELSGRTYLHAPKGSDYYQASVTTYPKIDAYADFEGQLWDKNEGFMHSIGSKRTFFFEYPGEPAEE